MLEVANLAFAYSRRLIFEGVSFTVDSGEVVAVVGDNGAGKTTLLRILASLAYPSAGRVLADGSDVFGHPLRYRRVLGYLGEGAGFADPLPVRKFLRYRAVLRGEQSRKIHHRVDEAIESCRLEPVADLPVANLSFGHRRRVAMADALLLRPRFLVADDPFAGIDCDSRQAVAGALKSLAGFSSIVVSGHGRGEFAGVASRFLELRDGRLRPLPEEAPDPVPTAS